MAFTQLKINKIQVFASIFVLSVFLTLSSFGLNLTMMAMDNSGMEDCLMMQTMSSFCPMNLADHIQTWFSNFAAVATQTIFLIAIAGVFVALKFTANSFDQKFLIENYYYRKKSFLLKSLSPLKFAFARGIINPKIY